MSDILLKILQRKAIEVQERSSAISLARVRAIAADADAPRGFGEAENRTPTL